MATYANIQYGSSGEDVRKLQQALIDKGYNVGSSGADGQFGSATLAAVKKYQTDNGIGADGIAGNTTLNHLYGTASTSTPAAAPDLSNTYGAQMNSIFNKLMNREKFSYDASADPLYQQYRDVYTQQGRLAMQDTMGQAAALTGGYGSSYGQAVGQQQYDAYLQKLNEVVPSLYGQAYSQYENEGKELANKYSYLQDKAADEKARIVQLMANTGYNPTAEEMGNANMTEEEAAMYRNAYQQALSSGYSSGGSGYRYYPSDSGDSGSKLTAEQVAAISGAATSKVAEVAGKISGKSANAPTARQPQAIDSNQGAMGGSYYSSAKANIKTMPKADAQNYLRELRNNGFITSGEYTSLVKEAGLR